jgi:hypothetical protein
MTKGRRLDSRDTEGRRQRIEKNKNKGYEFPTNTLGDDRSRGKGKSKGWIPDRGARERRKTKG